MDYWLGIDNGIWHWKHYCSHFVERLFYRADAKFWHSYSRLGYHGFSLQAHNGYDEAVALMAKGTSFANLDAAVQSSYTAYVNAPQLGPLHIVADLPALAIIILITALVYRGMRESRKCK